MWDHQQPEQSPQDMGRLVADLLEVLDTADAAVRHQIAGAELLRTQLDQVLGRHGVERLDGDGQPFDPTVHEAVRHEPGDGPRRWWTCCGPGTAGRAGCCARRSSRSRAEHATRLDRILRFAP